MQIDSTIGTTFGAVRVQQTWTALFMLEKILTKYKPNLIIEIGTGYGALTHFFSMFAPVHTFDVEDKKTKRYPGIAYHNLDVFSDKVKEQINWLILSQEKIFLLCDGGNKAKEFEIYASMVKKDDLILAHDWGEELHAKDIQGTVAKLGLTRIPEQAELDALKTKLIGFTK